MKLIEGRNKMIEKKTFIITIVVICIIFIAALVAEMFYYESRIQAIEESKNIVIIRDEEETGLENVIVE